MGTTSAGTYPLRFKSNSKENYILSELKMSSGLDSSGLSWILCSSLNQFHVQGDGIP